MSIMEAIESLYRDSCNVYEREEYAKANGSTGQRDVLVISDMPCRISYSSSPPSSEGEVAAEKRQTVKLFYSPERAIKAGSKVEVTRQGVSVMYKASGEAAIYLSHKETELELWDGKA